MYTVISLIITISGMSMVLNANSIAQSISGIGTSNEPHYTEYYKKARTNLKEKRFVNVSIGHPVLFGLFNKYDDYAYYCKSNEAVNKLKSQILNKKQLPTTNSNYILYNDEGKELTSLSSSYPSSYVFTVHKPKTGQAIVDEAKHSTAYMFYSAENGASRCFKWIGIVIILSAEVLILYQIWIKKSEKLHASLNG